MQSVDSIETILENSYKNFHAKGLDYLCLKRTDDLTVKVYFLDGDVSKVPEVVHPHDHRYHFRTTVLAGKMANRIYCEAPVGIGDHYDVFDWDTPLNGGGGFSHAGETWLSETDPVVLNRADRYFSLNTDVHTIQMLEDQTVLMLEQHGDVVPIGVPTRTFSRVGEPAPDSSGLYDSFTADEVRDRLNSLAPLLGSSAIGATS